MWKIQTLSEDKARVIFSLSGRLQADLAEELRTLLSTETRKITFDLKEVGVVDHEVVAFLSRCTESGVQLSNCPPYIEYWIAKERASRSGRNRFEP
jgi:hypothetical protein